jgi:hypothetical protein
VGEGKDGQRLQQGGRGDARHSGLRLHVEEVPVLFQSERQRPMRRMQVAVHAQRQGGPWRHWTVWTRRREGRHRKEGWVG